MKLQHRYEKISGWFNFTDIYKQMVNQHDKGHFVEIGTFFGKSASFMGVEIYNSKKPIKFDTIDTFQGSPTELDGKHQVFKNTDVESIARNNLKGLPVNVIKGNSTDIAKKYKNNSLDFVFIDGSHEYEDVKKDVKTWLKKVKKGGYIGGHDYTDHAGVNKAVKELLGDYPASVTSWLYKKV